MIIEELIKEWSARLRLSSGDDLGGFLLDVDFAFDEVSGVTSVNCADSATSLSLVNVIVTFETGISSVQAIGDALSSGFRRLAYPSFQASSVAWYREATVLRFITAARDGNLCVTGTMIGVTEKYDRLVDAYDYSFGSMGGRLQPFPGGLPAWVTGQSQ